MSTVDGPYPVDGAELRAPPHSLEAEQSVLGALLLENGAIARISGLVADDFYTQVHRQIFEATAQLIGAGASVDAVTLSEALRSRGQLESVGGLAYIGALVENVPTAANARRYAEIVREHARLRRLAALGNEIADAAFAPAAEAAITLDDAREKLEQLAIDSSAPSAWPVPLDFEVLSQRAPHPPRFIVADWLPAGYATLLAGHGGVGKSAIGLHMTVCIAAALPFFGVNTERRRVLYLSCEDRESILHWRLAHICAWLGLNMAELRGWLAVLDLVGRDSVLWERDPGTGRTTTPAFARLAQQIARTRSQVLVVDGVSDTFGGNENARTEVKRFVNELLSLIPADDGALVLLGHVARPAALNGATSEGYSGSTQWHNAVRARWYLYPETEKDEDELRPRRTGKLLLELQKSNLGRIDQAMTFEWDTEAHMFLASATSGISAIDRKQRDQAERAGLLHALRTCAAADPPIVVPAAMQGPRTAYHVLSQRPEFPQSLLRSTRRFWGQIEALRQIQLIAETEYRRTNRHVAAQIVLTPEGLRQCAE
jgi:RecA-family ATPase